MYGFTSFRLDEQRISHVANFAKQGTLCGWYDYRSVVDSVSLTFDIKNVNEETVGETLCRTIGKSMRLEYASLLLPDQNLFTYLNGQAVHINQTDCGLWLLCLLVWNLQIPKAIYCSCVQNAKDSQDLRIYGADQRAKHLIPLHGKGDQILGLLFLGTKLDGQELGKGDVEILRVIINRARLSWKIPASSRVPTASTD